jgi:hypothetical protein
MSIRLEYTNINGDVKEKVFENDVKVLHLDRKEIQFINLSPLGSCKKLKRIYLQNNQLQSIDLSPLESTRDLQTLWLRENKLQSIDLSPLRSCEKLESLELSGNELRSIDLLPLKNCRKLNDFFLQGNMIDTIDLSPLHQITSLEILSLTHDYHPSNRFKFLDVTPLSSNTWEKLSDYYLEYPENLPTDCFLISWLPSGGGAFYERPIIYQDWSFLYRIAENSTSDFRVQQDILYALGLGDYGFVDANLNRLFVSIPPETSINKARDEVRDFLVHEIVKTVEEGGATTGLNLDTLIPQHGELATKAKEIIGLRNYEMESLQLKVEKRRYKRHKYKIVDLRDLWLTAYGYTILSNNRFYELEIDLKRLERIEQLFNELGYELRTGRTAKSKIKMSDNLRKSILWIAKNRGSYPPWDIKD